MAYFDGYVSVGDRMDAKCGKGWEGVKGKCERNKNRDVTAIAATGIAAAGLGALLLYSPANLTQESLLISGATEPQEVITNDSLDEQIDKAPLPKQAKEGLKDLAGKTKRFVFESFLKTASGKLIDVDKANDIATFKLDSGYVFSVATSGSNLLVFSSKKGETPSGETVYRMEFSVDSGYERPEGGKKDGGRAKDLLRKTKQMYEKHIKEIDDNSFIDVVPFMGDDAGDKRRKIYERMGFVQLEKGDSRLWGRKQGGKFSKISDEEKAAVLWQINNRKRGIK